jgi:hypothetical protein
MAHEWPRAVTAATTSNWYDTSNRSAVRDNYNQVFVPSTSVPTGWTGDVAANNPGTTAQAFKDAVATRINWVRSMAGVPTGITLDATYSAKDQKAALMFSANRAISHNPPANWIDYSSDGAEAAGNSNICDGYGPYADPGCVVLYMIDNGSNNAAAGHRRWLLYPQTQVMGTGDVPQSGPADNLYNWANALWVFDGRYGTTRPATRDTYVAWPPPGYVPYQVVGPRWSFSYPGADFSNALVSMQRNGAAVPVRQEPVATAYGENTIVWVPDNLDANVFFQVTPVAADTTSTVTISNVVIGGLAKSFTYSVTVFDPATGGASPGPPSAGGLSPAVSTGNTQNLTVNINAPGGYETLNVVNLLINSALDANRACYLAYSRPAGMLYLVADDGATLLTNLSNRQCSISSFSVFGNGNSFALLLNLTFTDSFAGNKVIYAAARDLSGNNSGWQTMGVHGVPPLPAIYPNPVGMTPSSGSTQSQTITFTYEDESSAANLQTVWALINSALDARGACYIAYYKPANMLFLVPDNGDGSQAPGMPLPATGTLSNSQCMIAGQGAAVQTDGNTLSVTLPITFRAALAGYKAVWMAASTMGGLKSDWQALGAEAILAQ